MGAEGVVGGCQQKASHSVNDHKQGQQAANNGTVTNTV